MEVGCLYCLLKLLCRYLSRLIFVKFYELRFEIPNLVSVDHLYKHVHRSFLEHTDSLELAQTTKYIAIDILGLMIVMLAFLLYFLEPLVVQSLGS